MNITVAKATDPSRPATVCAVRNEATGDFGLWVETKISDRTSRGYTVHMSDTVWLTEEQTRAIAEAILSQPQGATL